MKNNLKAIGILISLSIFWYGVSSVASFYRAVNSVEAVEIETNVGEYEKVLSVPQEDQMYYSSSLHLYELHQN